jgi:hypothetical protein
VRLDRSFERHVRAAALSVGADGGTFECTVGGLAKDAVAALEKAIYAHVPVHLELGSGSVLLDLESLESTKAHTLRVVGRVLTELPPRSKVQ